MAGVDHVNTIVLNGDSGHECCDSRENELPFIEHRNDYFLGRVGDARADTLRHSQLVHPFLPALTREGEIDGKANLLGRFLKIFEKFLSGINDEVRLEVPDAEGGRKGKKL